MVTEILARENSRAILRNVIVFRVAGVLDLIETCEARRVLQTYVAATLRCDLLRHFPESRSTHSNPRIFGDSLDLELKQY